MRRALRQTASRCLDREPLTELRTDPEIAGEINSYIVALIEFKPPSTIDELRQNPKFVEDAKDAVVALIEFPARAHAAQ
jgi:hypothetical protein